MPTFDEKLDDAEQLLGQLAASQRRDHEAALAKLGAAVDGLDAHLQASFSQADVGEGPETRLLQQQAGAARSEYERMKEASAEARAGHRRALSELLQAMKQGWRRRPEHR